MSERDPTEHGRDPSWFEEWFASEYYLKLYSHRDTDEAERCVDLILRSTSLGATSDGSRRRALDLASGPGRHAIALARRGLAVTAVDLSSTLLEHSRMEADEAGVDIDFMQSDMRAIEFDHEFDLAVQLFTSFGYFEDPADDMLVLRHMRTSLRDGGWYALDLINERWLRENLVARSVRETDGVSALEERWIEAGRVNKRISIPARASTMSFIESVRLFSPLEIETMLRDAGFTPEKWCGDYNGAPFDPATSKRMLVLSRAT